MKSMQERKKALEAMLNQKIALVKQIETKRDEIITEVVRIQGKLELLNELERESSEKAPSKESETGEEKKTEVSTK